MSVPAPFFSLALGGGLQLFGFGRWMTAPAAWLAPIFLLHFAHRMPPAAGLLWLWLALALALAISLRGVVPIPGPAYLVLPVSLGFLGALPYLADRVVAPLLPGFWGTLVFPVTWTALEFLNARCNPYGTWGAAGYTQHGLLPLMQIASVTGIWGVGFLIGWGAAVANWGWDELLRGGSVQAGLLIFAGVTGAVLLAGGLRVALAPDRPTVRIAGIGWPRGLIEPAEFLRVVEPGFGAAERAQLRPALLRVQDHFLERSRREAAAGAKIIVWPEVSLIVYQEDEAEFLARARALAREHAVHLVMGLATVLSGAPTRLRNHALLLTPAGETAYDYTKITAVPGFEKKYCIPGERPIPLAESAYGRLASPICFDLDFDRLVRQLGRDRVDLILVPASDWQEIVPLHQPMAEFRAIENGCALFRITRWGASGAVDPYGRRLAWMDDFRAADNVMVAQLPIHAGVRTVYARIGDAFGWACVAGLAAGAGWFGMQGLR